MGELHIVLVPVVAYGHVIPMIEMAKLFGSRAGVKATIISTPAFAEAIKTAVQDQVGLCITDFPPQGSLLPNHIVTLDQMTNPPLFFRALEMLQHPIETILQELQPHCLVSDVFLPWTSASAAKLGIPRLVFHGTSYFARCATLQMALHKPFRNAASDSDPFLVPGLPDPVAFVRTQVPEAELREDQGNEFVKLQSKIKESDESTYGEVINSFHELEPDYAHHFKNVIGRRAWHIGPLSMCNTSNGIGGRHDKFSPTSWEESVTAWLDRRRPGSVVYVCFGSTAKFTPAQMHETAVGLEASGQDFIWVLKNSGDENEWMPAGFEEKMQARGMIIRGWAPQAMILDHPALGAFVTHCGWNSILEGVCAGVPMVTWPVFAEQFYNEKLVTDVLRTGVSVGNMKWQLGPSEGVRADAVANAVEQIMIGEGAAEKRSRAKYYKKMAEGAIAKGGSSYNCLTALIEDSKAYVGPPKQHNN